MTDAAQESPDEVLAFGARRRLPPRVAHAVVVLALIAGLGVGSSVALRPRVEAGHGSVAGPPPAAPDRSGRGHAAAGSTVRGYYLR